MNHRQRLLRIARGEMVDTIPFVPRIDLWHNAHDLTGTLPEQYRGLSVEEIHRAEGWPLHKMIPEFLKPEKPEDIVHRAIGLYRLKEYPYTFEFSPDVEIRVAYEDDRDEHMTHVEYHTPKGMVSVRHGYTAEMQKSGASITWVKEQAIKGPRDYAVLAHIFGTLTILPDYDRFRAWKASVGDDGIAVGQGLGIACTSPIHFIQKTLIGATAFYLHYNDHPKEMRELAHALEHAYNQVIPVLADSPADAILWSANVDDMITYPALYEKEFLPWCRKAADAFHDKGILLVNHPDGENRGLMDLIARSGVDIADAVTPAPMTKVAIEEYYDRWCRSGILTIHGGIPEMFLLEESTSWDDLKGYLDHLFEVIDPGTRFIASIGDTSPPNTVFDRLRYIAERFEKDGRLPFEAGGFRPVIGAQAERTAAPVPLKPVAEETYARIMEDVLGGKDKKIVSDVHAMLDQGHDAREILNKGMLSAMAVIGERFKDGSVFIPEVLLSARAMNEALKVLEPHLAGSGTEKSGRIVVGTVYGDLHDIGKNMVITMLKGVGFEVTDLGVNVKREEFLRRVAEDRPDIVGISALLTTTMPEMKRIIEALAAEGLRDSVKVIVGGAPVNAKFARDIGADGYAHDAGEAVTLVKRLLG